MFEIGFSELALIAIVALVLVGPKDLPTLMRQMHAILRQCRAFSAGVKAQLNSIKAESGWDDLEREHRTILDLQGNPQMTFDTHDIIDSSRAPVTPAQPPTESVKS
jgi:sec-independent protein translocase protein TatB